MVGMWQNGNDRAGRRVTVSNGCWLSDSKEEKEILERIYETSKIKQNRVVFEAFYNKRKTWSYELWFIFEDNINQLREGIGICTTF